jgi:hypothetical protein
MINQQNCNHDGCSEHSEKSCTICEQSFCGFHIESKKLYSESMDPVERHYCRNCAVSNFEHKLRSFVIFVILIAIFIVIYFLIEG